MPADMLRLFVFARHAESAANATHVLNTNPSQPVALTARGQTQARALGAQLANLHVDLAVGTRLLRTSRLSTSPWTAGRCQPSSNPASMRSAPGTSKAHASTLTGPGGTSTPWATACRMARASRTRCGATRARYGASWPGRKRLRSSSSTRSRCVTSRRPPQPAPPPLNGTAFPNAAPYLFDEPATRRAAVSLAALTLTAKPAATANPRHPT